MPRFDKTGPDGKGPMTGRRLGRCKEPGVRYPRGGAPIKTGVNVRHSLRDGSGQRNRFRRTV